MMYVTDVVKLDFYYWNLGDLIFCEAPTGSGKTTFILETLLPYAKAMNREILFLGNRRMLNQQVKRQIAKKQYLPTESEWLEGVYEFDGITVMSYQSIQKIFRERSHFYYQFERFYYIVCDEIHYIEADASFNAETIRMRELFRTLSNCLICISATMGTVQEWIVRQRYREKILWHTRRKIRENLGMMEAWKYTTISTGEYFKIYFYCIPAQSNIKNYLSFESYDEIEKLIEEGDKQEKWLIFQSNKEKAGKLVTKLGKSAYLLTAEDKNSDIMAEIIQEERFSCQVLVTTKVLDNGINLKDESLKHIVIDTLSATEFKQMLGRKRRIHEQDKIMLYIPQKSVRILQGYLAPQMKEVYNFLERDLSTEEICSRMLIDRRFSELLRTFYIWRNGKFEKNPLAVQYYQAQKSFVTKMISKMRLDDMAFVKEQLHWIGKEELFDERRCLKNRASQKAIEKICSNMEALKEKPLNKAEQGKFMKEVWRIMEDGKIKLQKNTRVPGKNLLNKFLEEFGLPFYIEAVCGKRKGEKTVWVIREVERCAG